MRPIQYNSQSGAYPHLSAGLAHLAFFLCFSKLEINYVRALIRTQDPVLKGKLKLWFSKFVIKWCRRSANSAAHELASLGHMYPANSAVEWVSDVPAQVAVCVAGDLPVHLKL